MTDPIDMTAPVETVAGVPVEKHPTWWPFSAETLVCGPLRHLGDYCGIVEGKQYWWTAAGEPLWVAPRIRNVKPRLPAGFAPWHGGDGPPGDWDGGEVLLRCGERCPGVGASIWRHGLNTPGMEIIGYRRKAETGGPFDRDTIAKAARVNKAIHEALLDAASSVTLLPDPARDALAQQAFELIEEVAEKADVQDDRALMLLAIRWIERAVQLRADPAFPGRVDPDPAIRSAAMIAEVEKEAREMHLGDIDYGVRDIALLLAVLAKEVGSLASEVRTGRELAGGAK